MHDPSPINFLLSATLFSNVNSIFSLSPKVGTMYLKMCRFVVLLRLATPSATVQDLPVSMDNLLVVAASSCTFVLRFVSPGLFSIWKLLHSRHFVSVLRPLEVR